MPDLLLFEVRRRVHGSLNPAVAADVVVLPIEELASRFARLAVETARRAITERGKFSIAVPGGSAAQRLLPSLVPAPIDWEKADVFWVDERLVPPDDPSANYRLARSAWLDLISIPQERIHRMPGDALDPAAAGREYARLLRERLGEPARIDLVLLGMGEDGHVASLFPGHRLLRTWDREVSFLDDAPKPPPRRMTLTLPTLTAARRIVVFATGPAKAGAIADVLGNEDSELPAALATLGEGSVTFLIDQDAAATWAR